jgi:hypothetical protein
MNAIALTSFATIQQTAGSKWWPGTESNRRRQPFQGCALPTELPGRQGWKSQFSKIDFSFGEAADS